MRNKFADQLRVDVDGLAELQDADVVVDGEPIVQRVHDDLGHRQQLLGAVVIVVVDVVLSSNDCEVAGQLSVAAVGGRDDGGLWTSRM